MDTDLFKKDLSSYVGKLLRDNFGRGPESVFVSFKQPFITIYLKNFLSPMERVLKSENQNAVIQTSRDILMEALIPEIKAYINVSTGLKVDEFYYDWNFHNHSGMFVMICSGTSLLEELSQESFYGKDDLHQEINRIGQQAQKVPEEVFSVKINERTILVVRTGIFITIEREFIRMGQREALRTAKRRVEKRLLHNNMRLETIFDAKIDDSFVAWDLDHDKGVILFIVNPNQHGGNELDQ